MKRINQRRHGGTSREESDAIRLAVQRLHIGVAYAEDLDVSRWEFAEDMFSLSNVGLTENDCRWLIKKAYVEHRVEITPPGALNREISAISVPNLQPNSVFALTDAGVAFAESLLQSPTADTEPQSSLTVKSVGRTVKPLANVSNGKLESGLPSWNEEHRQVSFNGLLVKQFAGPARNQQCVLNVLEEEGWPLSIYDPLPPKAGVDQKRRLRDTVYSLNQKQVNRILSFHADGQGERIRWQLTEPNV